MISAGTPQTMKKTLFTEPKDLYTRSQEDSCAGNASSDDEFTSDGASGSPGPKSALVAEGVIRLTCGDYQFTKVCIYHACH